MKLCTGVSSSVRLRAALGEGSVGALGRGDGVGAFGGCGGFVVVGNRIGASACFMCQLM